MAATAKKGEGAPICVLGLNQRETGAYDQSGNSVFDATNCSAQFNSTDGRAMRLHGQPVARAKAFGVAGSADGTTFEPKPINGSAVVADPFASLPFPEMGSCIDSASRFRGATATLDPGTYCGGIRAQAGITITLNPGVYIMKDGNFTVQSGSTVTATEVMIAFTGVNGQWPSTLTLMGGATMNVTSPASGPYAGIQFFGARETYSHVGHLTLGGAGNVPLELKYDGVMYFPTQDVRLQGSSIFVAKSPSAAIITLQLWLQGNAQLTISKENARNIPVPYITPTLEYGAMLVR